MIINPYSLPPLVISLLTLLLGIFVFLKNKKKPENITYLLFSISIFIWLFCMAVLFSLAKDSKAILFWAKIVFVGVTFIPITTYHFIVSFLKMKKDESIISAAYSIGVVLIIFLISTNLYISGWYSYFWGYYPRAGALHPFDIALYALLYGSALWLLYKNLKSEKTEPVQKLKIKYLLVGFFIANFACMDFIPNYGYCIYPTGYLFIFIMAIIFAYAIVKHQLMDFEVIIKKTLIFGGLFAIVYAVFVFFALLGQTLFERFFTQNRWVSMIPSIIVITMMLRPLKNFLVTITDRHLFQKRYNYKELLKTFTTEVLMVLELDRLVRLTKERLSEIIKIENCDIVLGEQVPVSAENGTRVPISFQDKTIGTLLLGRKKSDEQYTQDDFDILQPLSRVLGIAISNAKLFDELAKTRMKTAEKDKMATIGTLAAGMAHEIRNPITTIRNFADFLPEKHNDTEFTKKFVKIIPREIDRIESIARSLLEFSSSENTVISETFVIDEPVKTVASILAPQYKISEIDIVCNHKEKHFVQGHRIQIQDALFNIVNYILAESPGGSKVDIDYSTIEHRVILCIKNKDVVILEHIIKDVFEPVAGLRKEKRGFGFNLFVAKQLLERNGATLSISSNKKVGSEFRILFKKSASEQRS